MRSVAVLVGLSLACIAGCPAPPGRAPAAPSARTSAAAPEPQGPDGCAEGAGNDPRLGAPDTTPSTVRVNQVGYRPLAPKHGSLADGSRERLPWALRDQSGQAVAHGLTWVLGHDAASGGHVHEADFSCVQRPGFGYRLQIGGHTSPPFAIIDRAYAELAFEAFGFFYRHRSGVAIEAAYAGDSQWALPPGHLGDAHVDCDARAPCADPLDAARGWYGDGAMGKYTVGSALAVWTLQNLYERSQTQHSDAAAMGDHVLAMPEASNGHPDVLDAARWHLEWMLRLQIPADQPGSGLVHHKLHGASAVAIGTTPAVDASLRTLRGPSTAATLNLAAIAAQAARVWKQHDPGFAERCLAAAERAYEAARTSPLHDAAPSDDAAGLSYADDDLSDEAYWAAVELALTTGDPKYVDFVLASPWFAKGPPNPAEGPPPIIDWHRMQGPATLDLALVEGPFSPEQVESLRDMLRDVADGYLAQMGRGGYRKTLRPQDDGAQTTLDLLHNAMVLVVVGDLSQQPRYRFAAQHSLNWVMGRNAQGRVHVTGFGANPVEHPQHAYWSESPPPGLLVHGPADAVSDHGNAALAWVASALSDPE